MAKILKNTEISGALKATSFKKLGGTSSQLLKADGSVENYNIFLQTTNTSQAISGTKTFTGTLIVPDIIF